MKERGKDERLEIIGNSERIRAFIADHYDSDFTRSDIRVLYSDLFNFFNAEKDEFIFVSMNEFISHVKALGYQSIRIRNGYAFKGLSLKGAEIKPVKAYQRHETKADAVEAKRERTRQWNILHTKEDRPLSKGELWWQQFKEAKLRRSEGAKVVIKADTDSSELITNVLSQPLSIPLTSVPTPMSPEGRYHSIQHRINGYSDEPVTDEEREFYSDYSRRLREEEQNASDEETIKSLVEESRDNHGRYNLDKSLRERIRFWEVNLNDKVRNHLISLNRPEWIEITNAIREREDRDNAKWTREKLLWDTDRNQYFKELYASL